MDGEVVSSADSRGESVGERKLKSDYSLQSWCIGRVRVKGCDILWLRLAVPTPVPDLMNHRCSSAGLIRPLDTPTPCPASEARWVCLTRDWLFFSRMPFRGRLFEAKVPVSDLQIMCTSLTSSTQGKGLLIVAAKEWWARAVPPPSSGDRAAATRAGIAKDASVAARTFRSSGMRPTNAAVVYGGWASTTAMLGCEGRESRRSNRRAQHQSEETRAFLIECGSLEERNWLLYCLQAATGSPPPLGFLRTCAAIAETELLLQKLALFLISRGCLTLGSAVEPEFAGLALGICTSNARCASNYSCNNNWSNSSGSSDERDKRSTAESSGSPKPFGCLPCRCLAGVAADAAAGVAAAGGFLLEGDIGECLLQQPQHAKQDLLLLMKGDVMGYPLSEEVKGQLRHRIQRLEMMHKTVRGHEQQQHQQHATVVLVSSSGGLRGRGASGLQRPFSFFTSFGEVLLLTLQETLKGTWANATSRLRILQASCCCNNDTRCGSCCCCSCSSTGVQQQKLHYTKHGPMHMPHVVYRQYRRLLELAGPLLDEMRMQQARREELLSQHFMHLDICCCDNSSDSSSDTSSDSSSDTSRSSSSDCNGSDHSSKCNTCNCCSKCSACSSSCSSSYSSSSSCSCSSCSCSSCSSSQPNDNPQAKLKMLPRSVHPFFSQLMRAPYACLLLQQEIILWAEELASPCKSSTTAATAATAATGQRGAGHSIPCKKGSGENSDLWERARDRGNSPIWRYPGLGRKRRPLISNHPKVPRVGDECVICLEPFSSEAVMTRYPGCSHSYHLNCLGTWIDWQNKGNTPSSFLRSLSPYSDQQTMLGAVAAVLVAEDEEARLSDPCCHGHHAYSGRHIHHLQLHNRHHNHHQRRQQQEALTNSNYTSGSAFTSKPHVHRQIVGALPHRHRGCPSLIYPTRGIPSQPYIPPFTATAAVDRVAEAGAAAAAASRQPRHRLLVGLPRAAECAAISMLQLGHLDEPTCARRLAAFIGAAGPLGLGASPGHSGVDAEGDEADYNNQYNAVCSAAATLKQPWGTGRTAGPGNSAPMDAPLLHGPAAAGIEGCNTWKQLLLQLRDIEYWMVTAATSPQLEIALTLLDARGLPLSGTRGQGYFRPLRAFKDRCPMCQHTVTDFY